MKKIMLLFSVNIIAFSSLMVSVYSTFGVDYFLKIIIPSAIMFGTSLGTCLSCLKKENHEKQRNEDEGNESLLSPGNSQ